MKNKLEIALETLETIRNWWEVNGCSIRAEEAFVKIKAIPDANCGTCNSSTEQEMMNGQEFMFCDNPKGLPDFVGEKDFCSRHEPREKS